MDAAGIILADNIAGLLSELTQRRTLAAVPFGAKYRQIDFSLSNMVNAGINNVGIIMSQHYDSVMHHVQSGAVWDLDRKLAGLRYLPPLAAPGSSLSNGDRVESLRSNLIYIQELKEEYIVIAGTGYVGSVDFAALVEDHIKKGADITCFFSDNVANQAPLHKRIGLTTDRDGRIRSIDTSQHDAINCELAMSTYVMRREALFDLIDWLGEALKTSAAPAVLQQMIDEMKVYAHVTDELVIYLEDLPTYLAGNLSLLEYDIRKQLFHSESGPVMTKTKDSAATRYGKDARVSNSMIADGAVIEGEVRNSVIFRGARVKKHAVVENCVIMQDSTVGEGARLNYAILDKDVLINDGRMLSGYLTHPFYCKRGERI